LDEQVFNSKVDWWLGLILVAMPIGGLVSLGASLMSGDMLQIAIAAGGLLFVLAIFGGLVWPMRYTAKADHIEIRYGMVRSKVPYDKIEGICPTRNPISSPALSLDRLHIQAGSSMGPNVSPADKEGFLEAVAARAPHLERNGDRLVRHTPKS